MKNISIKDVNIIAGKDLRILGNNAKLTDAIGRRMQIRYECKNVRPSFGENPENAIFPMNLSMRLGLLNTGMDTAQSAINLCVIYLEMLNPTWIIG